MPRYLTRRNGFWRFIRRVPDEYVAVEKRKIVQRSTGVRILDDPRAIRAKAIAESMNRALENHWRALRHGDVDKAAAEYDAAVNAARRLGIEPPIDDAAQRTIAQLLDRIERLMAGKDIDRAAVAAVYDAVKRPAVTFRQAAEACFESRRSGFRNPRSFTNLQRSMAKHVLPKIGDVPVADLNNSMGTELILKVIEPIWRVKTKTAGDVRQSIESVLDYAKVRGWREGENPARWRGHLDKLLPAPGKVARVKHLDAMPYADVPTFMRKLRSCDDPAATALEFTILTAARSSQSIEAVLSEIDRKARVWTIPAERMKNGKEHRVPLSDAAMAIVDRGKGETLFPVGHNAMRDLLRRLVDDDATVHGFRSSFRDWAAERTNYPNDVVEMALAHVVGNRVENAYRRTDLLAKRKALMDDWAQFCSGK